MDHDRSSNFSVSDDVVLAHILRMKGLAAHYCLWDSGGKNQGERIRSVKALEAAFFGFLKILKPETFIEAGAHNAAISVRAKQTVPNMRMHAFEANPYNYERFSASEALRQHEIEYVELALSDSVGETTFNVCTRVDGQAMPESNPRSSILRSTDSRVESRTVTVRTTTLDTHFHRQMPRSSALWVDVEGANREVLSGGSNLLKSTSLIMIEVEDDRRWQGQWIAFEVIRHLMSIGLTPVICDFQSRMQYNVIFMSREALLNPEIGISLDYFHSVRLREGSAALAKA